MSEKYSNKIRSRLRKLKAFWQVWLQSLKIVMQLYCNFSVLTHFAFKIVRITVGEVVKDRKTTTGCICFVRNAFVWSILLKFDLQNLQLIHVMYSTEQKYGDKIIAKNFSVSGGLMGNVKWGKIGTEYGVWKQKQKYRWRWKTAQKLEREGKLGVNWCGEMMVTALPHGLHWRQRATRALLIKLPALKTKMAIVGSYYSDKFVPWVTPIW